MNIEEARSILAAERQKAEERESRTCYWGAHGPASLALAEALFAIIECQDRRLAELEAKVQTPDSA